MAWLPESRGEDPLIRGLGGCLRKIFIFLSLTEKNRSSIRGFFAVKGGVFDFPDQKGGNSLKCLA